MRSAKIALWTILAVMAMLLASSLSLMTWGEDVGGGDYLPLAPSADPAVDRITTMDSAMMFNTSKVDVQFVVILVNNGNINGTVTVDIEVNETGSGSILFSETKTGEWVDITMGGTIIFSVWSFTFSSETTYWVNITLSAFSTNSVTTNDQLWAPFIIWDIHDMGPLSFENINYGNFFHPSETIDLQFLVKNFGTYDEDDGFWADCTIYNLSATPWKAHVLYTDNRSFFTAQTFYAQTPEVVQFTSHPWDTPSLSGVKCRVALSTFADWDTTNTGNNITYWDVEIDDRYDAAVKGLQAFPPGPYAPDMVVDINTTVENVGNMDLNDVKVTCTITVDSTPFYVAYHNISSLPCPETDAGMGNYVKNIQFTPNWTVDDINGTAHIDVTITNAQDEIAVNDKMLIDYEIYAEQRNLELLDITIDPASPITEPRDVTFNVTIKNYFNDLSGFDLNTSIYDSTMSLLTYENVSVTKTIPGSGGVGYHEYVWHMTEDIPDGDYTVISTIYLVGDNFKDNNEKIIPFKVDYLHDLAIVNTTGINDTDVINIENKVGEMIWFGVVVENLGPVTEDFGINVTIYDEYQLESGYYDQPDHSIAGYAKGYINFSHNFQPGTYSLAYSLNFTGDEDILDNDVDISFTITSIKLPIAAISSPKNLDEIAQGGTISLNGSKSIALTEGANITEYVWTGNWTAGVLATGPTASIVIDELGWLGITLTVKDTDNQTASATVTIKSVEAVTKTFTYYGLKMVYTYRADTNVTPTAENNTSPGTAPLEYRALNLFYECGLKGNVGGKIYTVNVSLDKAFCNQSLLDLVVDGSLTAFSWEDAWVLPSSLYGFTGNNAWFIINDIPEATNEVGFVLGLFGKKIMGENATLSGVVSEDLGKGVDNVTVEVYLDDVLVDSVQTDENGMFEFTLDLGIYDLRIDHPDYYDCDLYSIVVGKSGKELEVRLNPKEMGMVTGTVKNVKTTNALEGATVELLLSGQTDVLMRDTTTVTGTYELYGLDFSTGYFLRVSLPGYYTEETDPFQVSEDNMEYELNVDLTWENTRPELSGGGFDPKSGLDSDKYSFWVTYSDANGDPPLEDKVYVTVDTQEILLYRNEGDTNFEAGVKYSVDGVKLSEGDHNVIFKATDTRGTPAFPLNMNEQVKVDKDTSTGKVTSLLVIAALVIIILIVVVIVITLLMFRKKAKKDQEELEQITPDVDTKVSELMCTGCGSVLPEGTLKCPKCGRDLKKIEAQHENEFKCPTCGAANKVGAKKCTACEKDFEAKIQDTTRMADDNAVADGIVAEGEQAEMDVAWKEPVEGDDGSEEDAKPDEEEAEEDTPEDKDMEELSDDEFDDGLTFEGFDEL